MSGSIRPIWRRAVVLAGLGLVVALPVRAETCARGDDVAALRTRMLQTELMVAALTCGERQRYNAFVNKHRAELVTRGGELTRYFKRTRGAKAQKSLDSFITRLANEASLRTVSDRNGYCADADAAFDAVAETPKGRLGRLAAERATADAHGVTSCAPPDQQAATGR